MFLHETATAQSLAGSLRLAATALASRLLERLLHPKHSPTLALFVSHRTCHLFVKFPEPLISRRRTDRGFEQIMEVSNGPDSVPKSARKWAQIRNDAKPHGDQVLQGVTSRQERTWTSPKSALEPQAGGPGAKACRTRPLYSGWMCFERPESTFDAKRPGETLGGVNSCPVANLLVWEPRCISATAAPRRNHARRRLESLTDASDLSRHEWPVASASGYGQEFRGRTCVSTHRF